MCDLKYHDVKNKLKIETVLFHQNVHQLLWNVSSIKLLLFTPETLFCVIFCRNSDIFISQIRRI